MQDFVFVPENVTVAPGAVVRFVNLDGQVHTATSVTPGLFDTGNIAPGANGTVTTPTTPGTYQFYCVHHAGKNAAGVWYGMVGNLTVPGNGTNDTTNDAPQVVGDPVDRGVPGPTAVGVLLAAGWAAGRRRSH